MSSNPNSSDFSYKMYSLQHLEEWLHDALECEDLTPQDIYNTIVNAVDENIEYHKSKLTRNIEVLSLLKGHRPSFEIDTSLDDIDPSSSVSSATKKDWENFWEEPHTSGAEQYSVSD